MPIKVNNVEVTTNKINSNNVSEEKLNGTKVYPSTVYYTVRFYDYSGGSLLKTQQVQQGGNATAPTDPTRVGYTFTGWDKSFTNVQSDLTVYGLWQQISNNYYVFRDVGDYNTAIGHYSATCPNDPTSAITHTYSQPIIEDAYNWDATFISTSTDLHASFPYTSPHLYSPTQFVAFCIEDLNQSLGSGPTPYVIYEVEAV